MALTSITKDFVIKGGATTEGVSFVTSSTAQTGTLQVNGGAAIAKNLIVGTTATIWGATNLNGNLIVSGYTQAGLLSATQFTATNSVITNNESVGGVFTATGSAFFGNTLNVTGNAVFNGSVNTFSGAVFVTGTNILTVGTGATTLGGTLSVAGVTSITNNTAATTGGAGALVVTGGEYIGGNLIVMSTAVSTGTTSSNALYIAGGIGVDKGGMFGGPVTFRDTVTFNGTSTYVFSTNTYYTDNIIELHVPPTGVYGTWASDDGKDIGLRFHYYGSGADQNAALVLADDTKYLEWYGTGAEASNGVFSSATYGTFKTGNIILKGITNATNTTSGTLQVAGGVGVGLDVYAGGNVGGGTLQGRNLTTSSGLLLSDASGNVVNSPVTYNYSTGRMVGTADYSNTATNITGGAAGSIPYQTAAGQTTMLAVGTNGYILTVSGGNPSWTAVNNLTAGLATTATNIAGGLKDQIAYQSAPGQTSFNAGLTFNGTTFTTTNIVVSNNANATGYNNGTGALQVVGGAAVAQDLWVGGNINLQGSLYLKGVGLDQITGTTGTFVNVLITGTNATYSSTSGALQITGGVGIGGGLFVAGIATATTLSVTSYSTLGGGATINAATVTNTLSVTGLTSLNGGATISALTVTNAATVGTSLAVTGLSSLNGGATISAATVTTTLGVTGLTSLNGGATISATTITGAATVGTSLAVTGLTSLNGGATISAATVTTTLGVTGLTSLNGGATISATTVTGAATVGTTLGVTGLTSLNGGATISAATVTSTLLVNGTAPSLGASNAGAIQTTGGVGIAKDLYVASTATIAGITYSTNTTPTLGSATAGAIQTTGGVGIAKDLYVGTTATIGGNLTVTGNETVTGFLSANGGATLSAATVTNNLTVSGNETVTGYSSLNGGATISAATVTNGLTVGTTLGVTGVTTLSTVNATTASITNLTVTGTASLPSTITLSNLTVTNLTVSNNETIGNNLLVSNLFTATMAATLGSTLAVTGIANFNSTQDSNATNNGSIVTAGGVGIAKNLVVGIAATIGSVSTQTVVPAIYTNNSLYSSYTSGYIVTNSQINLDTYSASAYRTAKYLVQVVDNTKIHVEEILVFHDGTNVYLTEYAIATSQGELGTFDANLTGGTVTLTFTANYTPTNMTIKMNRTTITL